MIRNRRIVIIVMSAVLLFLLASCDGNGSGNEPPNENGSGPPVKTNLMPLGAYTSEVGTLTFDVDSHDGWSSDHGYVYIRFAPDYIYLLGERE